MATVSYSELESLTAEFLPQRIALSLIGISYVHNTYTTNEFPAQGGASGDGGHGSSVAYACNSDDSPPSNSALLGLFATPGEDSLQCTPAAVSGG